MKTVEDLECEMYAKLVDLAHEYVQKRMNALLERLSEAFERVGWGVSNVFPAGNEEYGYSLVVLPDGAEYGTRDEIDSDFDVNLTLLESKKNDGSLEGVNFSLNITTIGGRIIGGFTPYNYSDQVWVPLYDAQAIEDRFAMMEKIDVEGTITTIRNFLVTHDVSQPEEYSAHHLAGVGNKELGLLLHEWHGGGGTGVYAVGSTLFADSLPDEESIERAMNELTHPYRGANFPEAITPEDVQAQANLAAELAHRFGGKLT